MLYFKAKVVQNLVQTYFMVSYKCLSWCRLVKMVKTMPYDQQFFINSQKLLQIVEFHFNCNKIAFFLSCAETLQAKIVQNFIFF